MEEILRPIYMENFKCKPGDCPDNCCHDLGQRPENMEYIKVLEKKGYRGPDYSEACPYFTGDKLCQLQIDLGGEALPPNCKKYPITRSEIKGLSEEAASISCPEIAKLVLFNQEGIKFKAYSSERSDSPDYILNEESELSKYFFEIRELSLEILSYRKISMADRLTCIGIIYGQILNQTRKETKEEIPKRLKEYLDIFKEEKLDESVLNGDYVHSKLKELVKDYLHIFKETLRLDQDLENSRYKELLKESLNAYDGQEGLYKIYSDSKEGSYLDYMEEKPYVLENIMVNLVYESCLPFRNSKTIWEGFMTMAAYYLTLRFILIGLGASRKKLDDKTILETSQSLSRFILENPAYMEEISKFFLENKLNALPYIAVILKN